MAQKVVEFFPDQKKQIVSVREFVFFLSKGAAGCASSFSLMDAWRFRSALVLDLLHSLMSPCWSWSHDSIPTCHTLPHTTERSKRLTNAAQLVHLVLMLLSLPCAVAIGASLGQDEVARIPPRRRGRKRCWYGGGLGRR